MRRASGRVRRPRHCLLYRAAEDGVVEIGRVLHDDGDHTAQVQFATLRLKLAGNPAQGRVSAALQSALDRQPDRTLAQRVAFSIGPRVIECKHQSDSLFAGERES